MGVKWGGVDHGSGVGRGGSWEWSREGGSWE